MNVESRVYLVINGNQYQTELLTWDNFCSFGLELTSRPGDPGAPHQHRTAHDAVVVADGLCQPHRALRLRLLTIYLIDIYDERVE